METKAFDVFKQEVSWFVDPTDKIELSTAKINFSDDFISMFPILYELVSRATVLNVTLIRGNDTNRYKLFSWTDSNGLKSGWLCKFEIFENEIDLLAEHQLLLNNIGGIQESYKQVDIEIEMLTDNQNFVFLKSECKEGLRSWKDYYDETCESNNVEKIDTMDLVCFVGEANGNETFYNLKTKQVLLFAPDHNFDCVEILAGQPEYTFYTINGVTTFIDYAETLAQQWLDNVVAPNN